MSGFSGVAPPQEQGAPAPAPEAGRFRAAPPTAQADPSPGRYLVIDARRSSTVQGGPEDAAASALLGREVTLENRLVWLDGTVCERWSLVDDPDFFIDLDDPILSDLNIPPVDGPSSSGDARIGRPVRLRCGKSELASLFIIDHRTLLTPSPSGLSLLILERRLTASEMGRLQEQLRSMKFYSGEATGRWDAATRRSVSGYAQYRGAAYAFHRAAITANLLDGMRVLQSPRPDVEEIKTVFGPAGIVAHFYGTVPVLAPRSSGVRRLAFSFDEETRQYDHIPNKQPSGGDWTFDLFSGNWVLLPAGSGGPYHLVATGRLREYLEGAEPDHVISCLQAAVPSAPPRWLSDDELELPGHCCRRPGRCRRHVDDSPEPAEEGSLAHENRALATCIYVGRPTVKEPYPELEAHEGCARIDDRGRIHLQSAHLEAMAFEDGLATAQIADAWYYLDTQGKAVQVLSVDNGADPFSEGLVRGRRGNKIAYFDRGLNEVIPGRYDFGWPFENGLALVCQECELKRNQEHRLVTGGRYGYIDSRGREIAATGLTRDEALDLADRVLLLEYDDFGPQSLAHEVLGMEWWQWMEHCCESRPDDFDVRVLVYRSLSPEKVRKTFPVIPEKQHDIRYLEYEEAIRFIDQQIVEDVHAPVTAMLKQTRQAIHRALGETQGP